MFSQEFLDALKSKADCRTIYESWGGIIRRNSSTCVHPERHKNGDKNPSMIITPQGFKCMVPTCGVSGDCFQLVREKMGCDFNASVVYVSALYGIQLPVPKGVQAAKQEAPKPVREKKITERQYDPNEFHKVGPGYLPEELTSIKEQTNFSKYCEDAYVNLQTNIDAQAYLLGRGINMSTAKECFLGSEGDMIVLPYTINYKVVYYSARSYKGDKRFNQPTGRIPCPIGFDNLKENRIIYVAEGLFDYLTLIEKGHAAIGVPGANNWKFSREWNSLLLGNKIMLCFHADDDGFRANRVLAEVCQGLSIPYEIVDWSRTRDFPGVKDLNDWVMKGRDVNELFDRSKTYSISDVKKSLSTLLDLSNYDSAIDLTVATVLANLMEGDPVWILLVGPPSVGKTEMIRSIENSVSTYFINRISPNTLTSGYTKTEYSDVITRIVKSTTFCVTDFGSFLSFHPQDMQKVMQQFRDIYDGKIHTEYGNGKIVDWSGKVGILGGITPEIERHSGFIGRLGDRFLYYRMAIPDEKRTEIAIRALDDNIHEEKLRKDIQHITSRFIDNLVLHIGVANQVEIPEIIRVKIAHACDLFSRARTPIARMHDMEKTIEYRPEYEFVGRVARAFKVLIKAIAYVRGRKVANMADYRVILDICHGSIPSLRLDFLHEAYNYYCSSRGWVGTPVFAGRIGKDSGTARYHLKNLLALGLIEIDADLKREHKWRIKSSTVSLIESSEFFDKPDPGFALAAGNGGQTDVL